MTSKTTSQDLQYDGVTETYRFTHDGPAVSTAIAFAIADIDGCDPLEMEPLHHAVPTDLVDGLAETDDTVTGDVMFSYRGYRITVDSHGTVVINRVLE